MRARDIVQEDRAGVKEGKVVVRARDIVQEDRAGVKEGKDRHVIEILLCGRETSFKRTELESKKERTDMLLRSCCAGARHRSRGQSWSQRRQGQTCY